MAIWQAGQTVRRRAGEVKWKGSPTVKRDVENNARHSAGKEICGGRGTGHARVLPGRGIREINKRWARRGTGGRVGAPAPPLCCVMHRGCPGWDQDQGPGRGLDRGAPCRECCSNVGPSRAVCVSQHWLRGRARMRRLGAASRLNGRMPRRREGGSCSCTLLRSRIARPTRAGREAGRQASGQRAGGLLLETRRVPTMPLHRCCSQGMDGGG